MHGKRTQAGVTLMELLIVVAIIGIIAAIALPNLMSAADKAKQRSTMAQMKSIGNALETYMVDVNFYPISSSMQTLETLDPRNMGIEPSYMSNVPTTDGWGGPLYYGSDTQGVGDAYTITSYGKDRKPSSGSVGATKSFDCDIIYQSGNFTAHPEGAQN